MLELETCSSRISSGQVISLQWKRISISSRIHHTLNTQTCVVPKLFTEQHVLTALSGLFSLRSHLLTPEAKDCSHQYMLPEHLQDAKCECVCHRADAEKKAY